MFLIRIRGAASVGLFTYLGEYASFLIITAWLSDKLVVQFGLGSAGYALVGGISGAYLILSGLLAIPMGHFCDRFGRRLLSVIACFLGGTGLFALLIVGTIANLTLYLVGVSIALTAIGSGHATYTASTLAYVGDVSHEDDAGKSYGILELVELFGYAFGPLLGGIFAAAYGRNLTFVLSGLMLFIAAGLASLSMPDVLNRTSSIAVSNRAILVQTQPLPRGGQQADSIGGWSHFIIVLKDSTVSAVVLTTLVMAIGFQAFYQYVPQYVNVLAKSTVGFGLVPSTTIAFIAAGTGVLMMAPFGYVEDETGRRMPWLVLGLFIGSASLFSVFFVQTFVAFVLAALVFGVGLSMTRVSQAVILAERTRFETRGAVMGTYHAVEHAGYGVGAIIGGTLAAALGFSSTFRSLSILLVLAATAFVIFALKEHIR